MFFLFWIRIKGAASDPNKRTDSEIQKKCDSAPEIHNNGYKYNNPRYEGCTDVEGIGIEMERLAATMGGTVKWPYNDSECLDADFFKVTRGFYHRRRVYTEAKANVVAVS